MDVPWARAPTSRHSVGTCHRRFAMARWARLRFALLWVYWFSFFVCVGPVVELPDVGLSDAGLSGCRVGGLIWKRVSAAPGEELDQAGHKSPTQAPQPPRPRQSNYIRGELNISMVFGALGEKTREEKSMGVSVGGCLKQNTASRRKKKREKK